MSAGNVAIAPDGTETKSGLAEDIYDALKSTVTVPQGKPGVAAKRSTADLANSIAVPVATYVTSGAFGDELVRISGNDTTSGYLNGKAVAGTGVSLVEVNDGGNETLRFDSNDGEIVHDDLSGFVANEHVDHSAVTLTAGVGLSGGGTITTSRTFDLEDTAVAPGTYGSSSSVGQFTVDQQGRITFAGNVSIVVPVSFARTFLFMGS